MTKKVAGLSFKGGRNEKFFLCLLEYFDNSDRWFLKSVLSVKDEMEYKADQAITSWIEQFSPEKIVVDFPLSFPACSTCQLKCPGEANCPVEEVKVIKDKIREILLDDAKLHAKNPKEYERARIDQDQLSFRKSPGPTMEPILSRSFKRKLKKGYLPYWNRPIDLWVWCSYYDHILRFFKGGSSDSFGQISPMLMFRFEYLKKHFPNSLGVYQSDVHICLLELLRHHIISKANILNLSDFECQVEARLDVLRQIERAFKIFIYENDLEVIVKNSKAFQSFILTVVGQFLLKDELIRLPQWAQASQAHFIVPEISK